MFIGTIHTVSWDYRLTQREVVDQAIERMVTAEALGFHSAWLTEHHFAADTRYNPHGFLGKQFPAYDLSPDPLTILSHVAAKTSRIRLGTGVAVLHFDDPLRLAERAALVDLMSGGRLEFGVGRGGGFIEPAAFHVPREGNRERFEEALEIIRLAWTGERFSFDGTFYQVPELAVVPRPLQRPIPPIYVAATSPDSFDWAGRAGLPYSYVGGTREPVYGGRYRAQHAAYLAGAAAAGHDVSAMLFPHVLFAYCAESDDEANAVAEQYMMRHSVFSESHYEGRKHAPPEDPYHSNPDEVNQENLRRVVREMLPLNLIGTPETIIERIEAYRRIVGLNYLLAYMDMGAMPQRLALRSMERFARDVMPHFASDAAAVPAPA
jgi:alkanesulfonate monooxygenase SsuD/methylene tetrahydromethanopterin reductase-like flavin-dependent oxidoreductase (luciferase family)